MTAPVAPQSNTVIFFELVPEYIDTTYVRPTCPDGSGDLWWDQESYIRYQSDDGPMDAPAYLVSQVDTADYCDGVDKAMETAATLCDACRAAYDARFPF